MANETTTPPAGPAPQRIVEIRVEDDRTGMSIETLRRAFSDHLRYFQAKDEHTATARDRFLALATTVRDRLIHRWIATQQAYYQADAKRVYYLSAEFLVGRSLGDNLINVGLYERTREALSGIGVDLEDLLEQEADAGLGNGGLGRLAACFLESMATLALPGYGYGIRYEFGIFDQEIRGGWQVEHPDEWLRFGNPWEIARPEYAHEVRLGGRTELVSDDRGGFRVRWVDTRSVLGVPYDTPVSGHGNDTVNTLRLWRARASQEFDLQVFNEGDYDRAVMEKNESETISKVLYPADHSAQGKELRLTQQYFFVSCSVQDILRRYRVAHPDFRSLPDKVAIQLNDTHPAIAVAELLRILLDDHGLGWDEAFDLCVRTCAYTNHTVMPEALERWPVDLFARLLPRHLEIIYEMNHRFLAQVARRWPGDDERLRRMSIIEEDPVRKVRMAHLAIVGCHSVNGVAALHTRILREHLFADFAALWPDRFNNKTNGITPRRWLRLCNPGLAALCTEAIGPGFLTDLDQLRRLEPLAEDAAFRARFRAVKQERKAALARLIARKTGVRVDAGSLFDVQIKRLHEYKRQLLNVLHVVALFQRLKHDPTAAARDVPRTFIVAGKAAPGYWMAKLIIKLTNAVADVVNHDPEIGGLLKLAFVPNYSVSLAQRIVPAADLSEQISTAGYEASGTGNMKMTLNGALTIGTLDGANVEIREAVGDENFFLFGLTVEEVARRRAAGYRPREAYQADAELRGAVDLIASGFFSPDDPKRFQPIVDELLGNDTYLVMADFCAYRDCQKRVAEAYRDPERWSRMAILNVARCGRFSSDRAIAEYARDIWGARPVAVRLGPPVT
jgi:glycogen phosphorylase